MPDSCLNTSIRDQIQGDLNSPLFQRRSTYVPLWTFSGFTEISSENGAANRADLTESSMAIRSVMNGGLRSRYVLTMRPDSLIRVPALRMSSGVNPLWTERARTSGSELSRPRAIVAVFGTSARLSGVMNSGRLSNSMRSHPENASKKRFLMAGGTSLSSRKLPEVYILTKGSPLYLESACSSWLSRSSSDTLAREASRYPHIVHPPCLTQQHPLVRRITTMASTLRPFDMSLSFHSASSWEGDLFSFIGLPYSGPKFKGNWFIPDGRGIQ